MKKTRTSATRVKSIVYKSKGNYKGNYYRYYSFYLNFLDLMYFRFQPDFTTCEFTTLRCEYFEGEID